MSHAKDEPDISDIYRYLTARSNSKLSFAYDESWPLLGTSAAVKCQSRMKPLAFFLFLGSLLSADPLKCTLSNVKASPELGARVDGETLRVAWVGERGTQLRAVFGIDGAAPVVRELAVGEAVLARNLTPEFTTVSGMLTKPGLAVWSSAVAADGATSAAAGGTAAIVGTSSGMRR